MRQCRDAFVSTISTFYIALFSKKLCFVAFFTKQRYIKVWYGWYESNSPLEQKYILRKYFISWFSRPLNCWKQWPKKQTNMTSFSCFVRPEKFHPYTLIIQYWKRDMKDFEHMWRYFSDLNCIKTGKRFGKYISAGISFQPTTRFSRYQCSDRLHFHNHCHRHHDSYHGPHHIINTNHDQQSYQIVIAKVGPNLEGCNERKFSIFCRL